MKKLIVILALTCLVTSNMAFAISDTGENSLGVYFDAGTYEENCFDPNLGVPFSMYFVMANCTQASVGGFEFGWEEDANISTVLGGAIFTNGGTNFGDNHNFLVGFNTPLITGPATLLVEISGLVLALGLSNISVGPSMPSSFGGSAGFSDGANPALLIPMNYATVDGINVVIDAAGWVRPGVGSLGCVGPVANEEKSWGGVKAIYR